MGSLRKNQILQILDRLCLRLCSVHTSDIISGWLSDVLVRPDRITTLKKLLYNICALQNKPRYQRKHTTGPFTKTPDKLQMSGLIFLAGL